MARQIKAIKKKEAPYFNFDAANAEMDVRRDRFTGQESRDPNGDNRPVTQIIWENCASPLEKSRRAR
jgi:hypothetical protein